MSGNVCLFKLQISDSTLLEYLLGPTAFHRLVVLFMHEVIF